MKYLLICFFLFALFNHSNAHPGIGIVKDSKGNIYYTDLKQVWKISIDGGRSIAVYNVHSHELYIDSNDDLYGEHLRYNGEQSDTWSHYAWCLRHNGKLDTIIKPAEGFLNNYSFARDGNGNMYWVQRYTVSKFKKKTVDGVISTIAEGKFRNIRWLYVTKGGTIYFEDLTDLYKLENGTFTLLAKDLDEKTSVPEYSSSDHNLYGIWTDKAENIYVAVMGGQVVKKINSNGDVSNIAFSYGSWKPCSGVFDSNDALWLLETNNDNEVRVRKIQSTEPGQSLPIIENVKRKTIPLLVILFPLGLIIIFTIIAGRKIFQLITNCIDQEEIK